MLNYVNIATLVGAMLNCSSCWANALQFNNSIIYPMTAVDSGFSPAIPFIYGQFKICHE